jgi:DHA2 family multidrug resistance protein-like MFS transporter
MFNEIPDRAGRRQWIGLAVLALPALLVAVDVFVMLLALPHLSAALGAGSSQQLWIMVVYGFILAGFLITMGTLGDRIGRRRLLLIGAAAFGAASVLAAFARTPEMLIAARAVLGLAGATIAPSTLSLLSTMFKDARQRGLAIGIWFMCFIGGTAIGPIVGGALLESFWWGSVFLLGVPAMVLLLVVGPILLPEYRDPDAGRLDLVSVVLSLLGILPLIYGLKELAKAGWAPGPLLAIGAGLTFCIAFIRRQRTLAHPLLDLKLFNNRVFSVALGSMLLGTMLTGAMMMFSTTYLQLVDDLPALDAGTWMLPVAASSIVSLLFAPLLGRRMNKAYLIGGGLVVSVAGLVVLTQVEPGMSPAVLIFGWSLINLGAGPFVSLGTDLVIGSAPQQKAGSAAAINETSGEFGYALGIAVLGSIGTMVYRAHLPSTGPGRDSLVAAVASGSTALDQAKAAYATGMHVVAGIAAVLLLAVAVAVMTLLRPSLQPSGQSLDRGEVVGREPVDQVVPH